MEIVMWYQWFTHHKSGGEWFFKVLVVFGVTLLVVMMMS